MLNEPVQEAGSQGGGSGSGSAGIAEAGSGHMNYIQVTPQEKEAIERVSRVWTAPGHVGLLLDGAGTRVSCMGMVLLCTAEGTHPGDW